MCQIYGCLFGECAHTKTQIIKDIFIKPLACDLHGLQTHPLNALIHKRHGLLELACGHVYRQTLVSHCLLYGCPIHAGSIYSHILEDNPRARAHATECPLFIVTAFEALSPSNENVLYSLLLARNCICSHDPAKQGRKPIWKGHTNESGQQM